MDFGDLRILKKNKIKKRQMFRDYYGILQFLLKFKKKKKGKKSAAKNSRGSFQVTPENS